MTTETNPSLKEQQQELTKDLAKEVILRGLADVILEEGVHAFSVQAVADRAGVSHRTVYRHFSTREELLEGLSLWFDKRLGDLGLPNEPGNPGEILDTLPKIFTILDNEDHMSRAMARVGLTTDIETERRANRTQVFRERIREIAPDLDDDEFEAAFAVIRSVASTQQWFILREQFGLDGDRSGPAVTHAVKVLIDDLRARNDAVIAKNEETKR
ncbi:MAG: TetR/AcrR family transcriptional regulator [Acidimicrobiia bacterium]